MSIVAGPDGLSDSLFETDSLGLEVGDASLSFRNLVLQVGDWTLCFRYVTAFDIKVILESISRLLRGVAVRSCHQALESVLDQTSTVEIPRIRMTYLNSGFPPR